MTELHLFAGAGGGCIASKWLLGHRIVGYVEKDNYCQKVLRARIADGLLDDAPIFEDVRTFNGLPYRGRVDCVAGGFPCQPFSVAGQQRADADERNCWPDTVRIIREVAPRFCFLENVPGLLSCGYFSVILRDLAEIGFDVRWMVLGASDVGAPHRRKRLWILAYSDSTRRWPQQIGKFGGHDSTIFGDDGKERTLADANAERLQRAEHERKQHAISKRVSDSGSEESFLADSLSLRQSQPQGCEQHEWRRTSNGGEDVADAKGDRLETAFTGGFPTQQPGPASLCAPDLRRAGSEDQRVNENWWHAEPDVGRVANELASKLDDSGTNEKE